MKSNEFVHDNSLGKPIRNYANFKRWFRDSVAVDGQGRPLVVYHGTGRSFDEFSLKFRTENQGNDQYGPGFYVATDPGAAGGYTVGERPNIMPLYVSIQRPMTGKTPPFPKKIIHTLITRSPNFQDAILNFGDPSFEGMPKVLNSAVDAYRYYEDGMQQLMTIYGDFWTGVDHHQYLALVTKLTGYDGVEVDFGASGKFFVAWQPNQLKSIYNNGDYSSNTGKIMGEGE
jgi:hypothetical protein